MIKIESLTRSFGRFTAVDGISFMVSPGEVLGFLGPNGAGKSTTMKILTGFLEATSGTVSVMGHDVANEPKAVQALVGYLPEGAPLYGDMTVRGFLNFIGQARGFRGDELKQRVSSVVQKVQLSRVLDQTIDTLSKGFKRRVGLAQAIIHDPKVLVLDEPTDGLDPNQKHQVRELIRNLSKDKIVIISTHILEEVSAVCTRALILASGKVVFDGTPDALSRLSRHHNAIAIKLAAQQDAASALSAIDGVASVDSDPQTGSFIVYPLNGMSLLREVNQVIHRNGWDVEELHVEKGRLDDVFRQVTLEGVST
ncbi:MAG: ATP-binding cassette domain-containing protein [Hahellaceae bacterium]|nr:ATP-binding cassette domain-containing protein [Hahellaceae bacterium]